MEVVDNNENRETAYGFLSVVEVDQLGYCGGLLVLSSRGRPVEFHCTAPVSANRAQQILYGQTLREFVCCDQIGVSLIEKVKSPLDLILVDDSKFLTLSKLLQKPVVFVAGDEEPDRQREEVGTVLEIAGQLFEIDGCHTDEADDLLKQFVFNLPATEPFERIKTAISEAHAEAA